MGREKQATEFPYCNSWQIIILTFKLCQYQGTEFFCFFRREGGSEQDLSKEGKGLIQVLTQKTALKPKGILTGKAANTTTQALYQFGNTLGAVGFGSFCPGLCEEVE